MILEERGIDKLYYKINGDKAMPVVVLNYESLIVKHYNYRSEIIPIFSDEKLRKLKIPISIFIGGKYIMFKIIRNKAGNGKAIPKCKN